MATEWRSTPPRSSPSLISAATRSRFRCWITDTSPGGDAAFALPVAGRLGDGDRGVWVLAAGGTSGYVHSNFRQPVARPRSAGKLQESTRVRKLPGQSLARRVP